VSLVAATCCNMLHLHLLWFLQQRASLSNECAQRAATSKCSYQLPAAFSCTCLSNECAQRAATSKCSYQLPAAFSCTCLSNGCAQRAATSKCSWRARASLSNACAAGSCTCWGERAGAIVLIVPLVAALAVVSPCNALAPAPPHPRCTPPPLSLHTQVHTHTYSRDTKPYAPFEHTFCMCGFSTTM